MSRPALRGRPWPATDQTGGPFDLVLDEVRKQHPSLVVERLTVLHPGDDMPSARNPHRGQRSGVTTTVPQFPHRCAGAL